MAETTSVASTSPAALHRTPIETLKAGFQFAKQYKTLIAPAAAGGALWLSSVACGLSANGENTPIPGTPERTQLFQSAQEVSAVRGGDPSNWVLKVEVRDGMTDGKPDPNDIRFGHAIDGTSPQVNLVKNEWMYRGSMSDLKPEYQIPQTVEGIAAQLGGNVRPENIRVVRITHDKNSPAYAKWMDLWQVEEGTIIGYELMQNHQTIDGNTGTDGLVPYEFNLPPGCTAEMYDDRQDEEPSNDIAATIYNGNDKSMKLFVTGATVWPWGDPGAITIEQSNYTNGAPSATTFAMVDGKIVELSAGSNFLNSQTAHAIVRIDPETGRVALTGAINVPNQAPVKDENAQ